MAYFKKVPSSGNEGKITYSEGVLDNIILIAINEVSGVSACIYDDEEKKHKRNAVRVKVDKDGIYADIDVLVSANQRVSDVAFKVQENIKHNVEAMTKYHVANVNVNVLGVMFDDNN